MSKKNRKNNKNMKGKENDGRGSSTGGGSSNNNNNHNNNNSIPTVDETVVEAINTTTTTTMALTQKDLEHINNQCMLKGYPQSTYFVVGYRAMKAKIYDLAVDAFIRGAENDGCVPCMLFYWHLQYNELNNVHLVFPWALECSIRGHILSMGVLMNQKCEKTKPVPTPALSSFWVKIMVDLGDTSNSEEMRKEIKKDIANVCYVCEKEDSNDKTFEKCGICKYYSYCGKDCQTYHWKELNHMGECRHLKILRTCCKPHHVKEIREAIISGVDPKDIPRLQNLRMDLGLNRPMEEYEELLLRLGDDNGSTIQDRHNYFTARNDGTVHIGSTPNVI